MGIERSSPHPDSARHLLQIRAYEGEGTRVCLVEYERPRRGGDVLSEAESSLLPLAQAKTLYLKARHSALEDVPEVLRAARPRPPRESAEPGTTRRAPPLTLRSETLERLQQLAAAMAAAGMARADISGAADLAVLEPTRAQQLLAPPK